MTSSKQRENNKKHVMLAIVFSTMAMFINYAISFFLTPYITTEIGTEAYGFVTLAKTFSNYGVIITSCLNAYAIRFITVSYHKGDVDKAKNYYSTVLIADTVLLVVCSLLSLILVNNIQMFFVVPNELLWDVKILFFVDIVNFLLLTIANVYTVAGYIRNRLEIINTFKIAIYISEAIVLIIAFKFFTPRLYYVGIGLLISTIVFYLLNFCYKCHILPDVTLSASHFSFSAVKELLGRGTWSAISQIGNILNSGLDLWVTNLMLDPISMGELSIVKTVYAIFSTIPSLITQPFQPILLKRYSESDSVGVIKTLKLEMKLMGFVTAVAIAGFIVIGKPYFQLWTPNQNADLLYKLAIITVIGFLFDGVAYPLFYVYSLTLKNIMPCIVTLISGLLNLVGMYLLISYTSLGLYAVVGTTTVLGFATFFVFTPIYTAYCLKIKRYSFFSTVLRICVGCIALTGASWILLRGVPVNGWGSFIIVAFLVVIISFPIYFFSVFEASERRMIIGIMLNRRKRVR